MLVKIFGAIDVLAGIILIFGAGVKLPFFLLIVLGIILIAKSFVGMFKEIGSWIDLCCGVFFLLSASISMPIFISIILAVLILQKGVVSFL